MRAAWRITVKDMLLRMRDRSAFVLGILAPLVLAFIFNLVFGAAFGEGSIATIGYADEDGGEIAGGMGEILASLADSGIIEVERFTDGTGLRSEVEAEEIPAGIIVPAGLSEAVLSGQPAEVTVVGSVDAPTVSDIATGVARAYATSIADAQRAVAATLQLTGGVPDPERIAQIAGAAAQAAPLATVGEVEAENRILSPDTFFAASMAVFFLFFLVQVGVIGLLDEKEHGTLTRLEAAPIPRWSIPLGKAMTSFFMALVSLTVLAVATTLLMGSNWGDPLPLAALFIAVALAATSLVGIVAAFARTPEGAGNLVAIIAVAMGMVGGSFFPVAGGNRALELVSYATPHSWFLRGVGELHAGGGFEAILPSLLALLVFTVVGGAITTVFLGRRFR